MAYFSLTNAGMILQVGKQTPLTSTATWSTKQTLEWLIGMGSRMRRPTTATLETGDEKGVPYIYSFMVAISTGKWQWKTSNNASVYREITDRTLDVSEKLMFKPYYVYPSVAFPDFRKHGWLGEDPSLLGRSFFRCELFVLGWVILAVCALLLDDFQLRPSWPPLRSPILPLQNWSQVGSGWSCGREMAKNRWAAKTGGL